MDAQSAAQILRQTAEYRIERPANWQGALARGGPRYLPSKVSPSPSVPRETHVTPDVALPQSKSLWHIIEAAVGGGQQGKLVSRLMQKHLMARVDALSVDEIDLMAGGESRL